MSIRRFELFTISSRDDLVESYDRGLLDPEADLYCIACDYPVGEDLESFEPFAIVISEKRGEWLVCEACHYDTTSPTDELD